MAVAIKVENLSKAYRLGEVGTGTLSRDIERWFARRRGKEDPFLKIGEATQSSKSSKDIIWPLKDLNFEINQGEALGIIGRNGAGKSTLLKILSRITTPTRGEINIRGRVASLLEVGTGFHPDLTGRENIYLNGAILGMRKKEIARKFDEIVNFAGVEPYIDTPVKRYSSGMYVRLAFAVAAHLESEVLIVDEVLAVGDAEFQRQCLGKMGQITKGQGKTVLFVSHNMDAIRNLCSSCLLLKGGQIEYSGDKEECLKIYLNNTNTNLSTTWKRMDTPSIPHILSLSAEIIGCQPMLELRVRFECLFRPGQASAFMAIDIKNSNDVVIMQALPEISPFLSHANNGVQQEISVILQGLVPGIYFLSVWLGPHNNETYDLIQDVVTFEIHESPTKGRTVPHTQDHGFIVPSSKRITSN